MDQDLQKQVRARLEELPDDVRKAVMAADLDRRIQAIGNKHHLHIDQTGKLGDETLMVMLAFTDPSDFASQLEGQLGVSRAEAESIAQEVSNDVFMPIRESMKTYVEEKALLNTLTEKEAPKQATTSTPTTTKPAPTPPAPTPKPQVPLAPHPHDLMLTEKTVTTPPAPPNPPPPTPKNTKRDPYREPTA